MASYLEESPLYEDQTLEDVGGETVKLRATVKEIEDLKRWLMGIGHQVEVLKPYYPREEFAETARTLANIYR